jgi:HEAT repeat protein
MRWASAARLFVQNALWRATGLPSAGRALIRALGSEDEDVRAIAGMFLAQARERAVPFLEEALRVRESLPMVLAILGDIGDRRFEPELVRLSQDRDPAVAKAARDALRVLGARQRPPPTS